MCGHSNTKFLKHSYHGATEYHIKKMSFLACAMGPVVIPQLTK